MAGKFKIIFLLIIIIIIWKGFHYSGILSDNTKAYIGVLPTYQSVGETNKIKITVYYEALCSDSRSFILKQLVPAYENLQKFIELDLVPYGKAKTVEQNGQISFQCQHAATECLANKIHACSLAEILEPALQLKYIACMINDNMIPHEVGERCANELNIKYDPIRQCANGEVGSLLLKSHGIQTHAVNPTISFIPTIELDGSQKIPLVRILKNLQKELCSLINPKPNECL